MKRGILSLNFFVWLILGLLGLVLVYLIISGFTGIITGGKMTAQDQDAKRVIDAFDKLIDDYDSQKIGPKTYLSVPLVSEDPMKIGFYPARKGEELPPRCKGRPCLCVYYVISDTIKETCKPIEINNICKETACGGDLCAGDLVQFDAKKGDNVKLEIECTTKGTQLTVMKI